MSAYPKMVQVHETLAALGIPSVLPDLDDDIWETMGSAEASEMKRRASLRHMRRIRDRNTFGVLIVNVDKYGQHDYIGPNAFAEAAIAFASRRRIYLLQGIPDGYQDELEAWGAVCLWGEVGHVEGATREEASRKPPRQLTLFS